VDYTPSLLPNIFEFQKRSRYTQGALIASGALLALRQWRPLARPSSFQQWSDSGRRFNVRLRRRLQPFHDRTLALQQKMHTVCGIVVYGLPQDFRM
jgi:hypothetical protein